MEKSSQIAWKIVLLRLRLSPLKIVPLIEFLLYIFTQSNDGGSPQLSSTVLGVPKMWDGGSQEGLLALFRNSQIFSCGKQLTTVSV
jgi:hypothetical protein